MSQSGAHVEHNLELFNYVKEQLSKRRIDLNQYMLDSGLSPEDMIALGIVPPFKKNPQTPLKEHKQSPENKQTPDNQQSSHSPSKEVFNEQHEITFEFPEGATKFEIAFSYYDREGSTKTKHTYFLKDNPKSPLLVSYFMSQTASATTTTAHARVERKST